MGKVAGTAAAGAPRVSVIVCTFNRAKALEKCLGALAGQAPPAGGMEIIVVDDGSTDDTPQVCRRLAERMPAVRCVRFETNQGMGKGRNLGTRTARGELLLFIDDDCTPSRDWALRLTEALEHHPVVAGAVDAAPGGFIQLCHNVAQFYGNMPCQAAGPASTLAGANMAFRRDALERLGGFDGRPELAEDLEVFLRAREAGYQPYFCPESVVLHDPQRHSLGVALNYAMQHAAVTVHLRNRYRTVLRTPWVLRSPTLLLAASPLIALGVTARIFLGAPALLKRLHTAPVVYALKVAWCIGAARGLRDPSRGVRSL
jgi:GT2 family glycosyltransferase